MFCILQAQDSVCSVYSRHRTVYVLYTPGTSQPFMLSFTLLALSRFGFVYIWLAENRFIGQIPHSWAMVARPNALVVLISTYLSCCGVDPLPVCV